ncbi:hypothetical protein BTO06_10905 [Tenacibaculum sp. SZ-18]|uniref:serine hydrolase domain-containing protein n=1 Tax=Tenacibaculum sp. SZ-18 TaxID=754423 RepID=UPI000C2D0504|nr:serine hydrolase domain-containing protein [Tenacibaculum sp. SZ-18]AUC15624.1 hypothetical protein BTO06_10905 [Tenacibaculum sp. SZ-18]
MRTIFTLTFLFILILSNAQTNSEISEKTINEITEFIQNKKDFYNSPSIAVAITDETKTIYLKHFGDAKKGDKYLIGSNSKSFTALLILKLQEEGKLNIHDPVIKYLPWFKFKNKVISDQITIEDLLRHTSGLSTELGRTFKTDPTFNYIDFYTSKIKSIDLEDISERRYNYSNANYRILAYIIEEVTNRTFKDCLNSYITTPLGLVNTSADIKTKLINSYQYFLYYPIIPFETNLHPDEAASGLISSSIDNMATYLRHIMNAYNNHPNTKLSNHLVKQLFTKNERSKSNYGLGWKINNDSTGLYHGGTNKSFESHMYILPSLKKAIVVLINSNQAPDVEIINGIYGILSGKGYYDKSSFAYYRHFPILVLLLCICFISQFIKWQKRNFHISLTKKILPNLLLLIGVVIGSCIFIYIPKLNGVSLKTATEFDPTSGYSIVLTSLLIITNSILIYINANLILKK